MRSKLVLTMVALLLRMAASATAESPRLTLERLYSLPHLIGTAPGGFAWSPDSTRLAFLWNDQGENFRDVWMVEISDPELNLRRLTRMPRPAAEADANEPVAAARVAEHRERHPGVTSIAWHPDGRRLLASFEGDLWLVGGERGALRWTETEAKDSAASFSPDGGLLAFLREGDLWTMRVEEGQGTAVRRTHRERPNVELADYRWSPDGSRIALLETDRTAVPERSIPDYLTEEPELVKIRRAYPGEEPVRHRLGVLDPRSGQEEILWLRLAGPTEAEPEMLLSYRWSPDGRLLAVDTCDLYAKDRRVFVVDLQAPEGPSARPVIRDRDPANETFYFWRIEWSVDGSLLYFLSDRRDDYHVWAVAPDQADAAPRPLTRGAWAVAEMHPVAGGLVVMGNRGRPEERQVFLVGDDGSEPVRWSERPGTHAPIVSPDGRYAAVLFSSDDTPPDLFLTSLREPRRERRVTRSPLAEFSSYRWATPSYVTFPSHVDGSTLYGRLTLPTDFDPERTYPAILGSVYTDTVRNQWGGRTAHPTWGLDQYLAQQGYVLLNVDVRGSWGRGREHRRGIRLDYGGMDIQDLESGVRYLAALGYVDRERIGIWGSSYGGLMTAMSLFRKPGLYAAGIAGAPATNVRHALTGQMAVMMRPQEQPEEYDDSSPYLHAHGLEDPLMIIHGMRDRVVLYKDSVVLVDRLIRLGKNVDLVTLPDAGHGWDNEGLAQTRFAFRKMVEFFDRHLAASGPAPPP